MYFCLFAYYNYNLFIFEFVSTHITTTPNSFQCLRYLKIEDFELLFRNIKFKEIAMYFSFIKYFSYE